MELAFIKENATEMEFVRTDSAEISCSDGTSVDGSCSDVSLSSSVSSPGSWNKEMDSLTIEETCMKSLTRRGTDHMLMMRLDKKMGLT
ncbi:hypothetical protein P8452_22255 [Trifolium repens]|nr:hypothetical protein P8452_22255 [Trifolium repens]